MSENRDEVNPDLSQIEAYAQAKRVIARDLHFLRDVLQERKSERLDAACRDLMVKLAEDHFTLAVLGQFKRGKSSLMNAIIGRPLLPMGVLPLTSAITVLRFGSRERLLIERDGSKVVNEAPLSEIADYVTEKGNPANRKGISRAIIEVPSPFLRRGLEFVDTPGVGSAIEANTAITRNFLPECDAVVFITAVDSPLSNAEMEFLSQIREHVRKVFFVANKTDLLGDGERKEVLQFISQNLQSITGSDSVRVFPLSCQAGLKAKIEGDTDGYARSGVKCFEETVSGFLSTQRMSVLLVSIIGRAIAVIDDEIREIEIEARAASLSANEVRDIQAAFQERLDHFHSVQERDITSMRDRLLAFAEEHARQGTLAVLQNERETRNREVKEAISHRRWRLSYQVIGSVRREQSRRLNDHLDRWTAEAWENLWPVFEATAQQEVQALLAQFGEIPKIAAEVLKLDVASLGVSQSFDEVEVERNSRALSPRAVEWRTGSLPVFSFLPAFMALNLLSHYCCRETERMVDISEVSMTDAIVAVAEERLDSTILRIRKAARKVEERVKAAVSGKVSCSSDTAAGQTLARQRERLEELRVRLTALRDQIEGSQAWEEDGTGASPASFEYQVPAETSPTPEPAPVRDTVGISFDLASRGCPICDRVQKAMMDFFSHLQYQISGDEASQSSFATDGGLCRLHTWQLEHMASPQGLSRGYPQLLHGIASKLSRLAADDGEAGNTVLSYVQDSRGCRACQHLRTSESQCLERFAIFVQKPDAFSAYEASQGLCLRHLGLLLGEEISDELKHSLLNHAANSLARTAEDMQSYALKHDALRRGLCSQDEEDAYRRALTRLAGEKYLAVPDIAAPEY